MGSKCCLLPFKVAPHPVTLTIWLPYQLPFFPEIWWHSWIGSPVISPLERQRRRGPARRPLKILNRGGMPQWQEIFMARNSATASLERQTIYFSKRRRWWGRRWGEGAMQYWCCVYGAHDCKISPCVTVVRVRRWRAEWFLSLGRK